MRAARICETGDRDVSSGSTRGSGKGLAGSGQGGIENDDGSASTVSGAPLIENADGVVINLLVGIGVAAGDIEAAIRIGHDGTR